MTPLEAAASLARTHRLPAGRLTVLKDGSNLLVHLAPAPVVLRIATFTGQVRGDPVPYLERELDLVTYLVKAGAPVMAPTDLLPPGPHVVGGWAMNAWRYVVHERGVVPDPIAVFHALDELHRAMRGYGGSLPVLNPAADDLDRALGLAVAAGLVAEDVARATLARRDELLARLLAIAPDGQALHGDAFPRNTLLSPRGVVWIDLEDCCSGPPAWDLAVLIRRGGGDRVAAIARRRHGDEVMRLADELRAIQAEAWNILHDARHAGRFATGTAAGRANGP